MIISFSVQNFRSIRDKVTLDFRATSDKHQEEYFVVDIPKPKLRILKMAMIYGANASGKTSILMALDFLRGLVLKPVSDKNIILDIPSFAPDKDEASSFEIEFYYQEICYSYKLVIDHHRVISETLDHYPKGVSANVFERTYKDAGDSYSYKWSSQWFNKKLKDQLIYTIQNQTIISKITSIKNEGPLQRAHDWFHFALAPILRKGMNLNNFIISSYLDNPSQCDSFRNFAIPVMKKADFMIDDYEVNKKDIEIEKLPKRLQEIVISDPEMRDKQSIQAINLQFIHHSNDTEFKLDIQDESEGTQRFWGFSGLLFNLIKKNDIIPIDEIESSLHNDLLFHFIAMFLKNSKQGQLIFTSHNTALMNEKEIIRRDCIWITDRKADGSTELTSVSDYPVRKEHAIDSLYRKGLLGGLPNLGSKLLDGDNEEKSE